MISNVYLNDRQCENMWYWWMVGPAVWVTKPPDFKTFMSELKDGRYYFRGINLKYRP